jgi:hypothetical protein
MAEARAADPEIKSIAPTLLIKDQIRLGAMRLQFTCEEALWISRVAGDEEFLSYEKRILNSAYVYVCNTVRNNATVLVVTNSNVLRDQALTRVIPYISVFSYIFL